MKTRSYCELLLAITSAVAVASAAFAQQAPTPPAARSTTAANVKPAAGPSTDDERESVVTLTPFEVSASAETGYGAATTSRVRRTSGGSVNMFAIGPDRPRLAAP